MTSVENKEDRKIRFRQERRIRDEKNQMETGRDRDRNMGRMVIAMAIPMAAAILSWSRVMVMLLLSSWYQSLRQGLAMSSEDPFSLVSQKEMATNRDPHSLTTHGRN